MFYLFELSIGIDGQATIEPRISTPNQGTQCSFRDGQWNSGSFAAFRMRQKWGPQKWTDATRNFWTSKCEGFYRRGFFRSRLWVGGAMAVLGAIRDMADAGLLS